MSTYLPRLPFDLVRVELDDEAIGDVSGSLIVKFYAFETLGMDYHRGEKQTENRSPCCEWSPSHLAKHDDRGGEV